MSAEQLEPGTLLNDRYRILRVIGRGGMGTVYQAEHIRLDTILAIKEVRAPLPLEADSQSMLEQCQHEARFLVRLHHPNLPQVTDAFVENDRFFVVMEYIEGFTLEWKLRMAGKEGLPVSDVIEWSLQIADVLSYLHSQNPPIIFRDLKPSNVMLQSDGRVRLIDFGIARRFQPGAVKDTSLLGSVGYSPPEQFGRHQTDTRSDIFSFGATLHHLLTGRDPAHSPFKFTSARALNPTVPEPLSRLIDFCLRLDADARPQHIHEVAMELLAIRDSLPALPVAPTLPVAAVPQEAAAHSPSGNPKIILTNPNLRSTVKIPRGSQKVGSQAIGGSLGLAGPEAGSRGMAVLNSDTLPAQSVPVPPPPFASPVGKIIIGASIALAAALTALVIYVMHTHSAAVHSSHTVAQQPFTPANPPPNNGVRTTGATPVSPVPTTPNPPSDTGTVPAAAQNHAVTFQNIAVKDVSLDPQGKAWLRLTVSGVAQGRKGDQMTIAAFFYDGQNTQIAAPLPQSPYASKNGKVSVASPLALTADIQSFSLTLELPVDAFPAPLPDGLQFHCAAFFQDQRIGESQTYVALPASLFNISSGGTNGDESSPSTGGPAPDPAHPPRKVFGTSRGNE